MKNTLSHVWLTYAWGVELSCLLHEKHVKIESSKTGPVLRCFLYIYIYIFMYIYICIYIYICKAAGHAGDRVDVLGPVRG